MPHPDSMHEEVLEALTTPLNTEENSEHTTEDEFETIRRQNEADADERARIRRAIEAATAADRESEQHIAEGVTSRQEEMDRLIETGEGARRGLLPVPSTPGLISWARNRPLSALLDVVEDTSCETPINECNPCLANLWVLQEHAALNTTLSVSEAERLWDMNISTRSRGGINAADWRRTYGEIGNQRFESNLAEPDPGGATLNDGESTTLDNSMEPTRGAPGCDCGMCSSTDAARPTTPNPLLVGPQPDDRRTAKAKRLP